MKNFKMTKLMTITLVTLFFLMIFPQKAYADIGGYTYQTIENGIVITGYNGDDSNLTIPQEIDGLSVVGIGNDAFSYSATLSSVVLPEGITNIGSNAFYNCSNLSNVRFVGDAPSIGEQAFSNCSSELMIYYDPTKNGFGNPWNGFSTQAYISTPEISPIPDNSPVTGITLDKTSVNVIVGESLRLLPSINPTEASNKNINWTSNNTDVVTVDATGLINVISEGNAIITVTTEDGGFTAACSVNAFNSITAPENELAVPQNYSVIKLSWSEVSDVTGFEVYRSDAVNGEYLKVATVQSIEYSDIGLNTGTVYYYKIRAYKAMNDANSYSDYTQVLMAKTLDKSIGSTLFLYMSNLNNSNSVVARAVVLHNGNPSNTCAYTVSEALRRLGVNIPNSTARTNEVESHLIARGWKREMNLNLLQPGDICFTTDKYGNLLGGHSTHVFIFLGWANKEKTLMNICDNQTSRYSSVIHTRSIFETSMTDATAFFYHTNLPSVDLILKLPSIVNVKPIAYNKVKVSWGVAAGAYGYKIYKSTSRYGTYRNIATTNNTSYVDPSVSTGRTYYYMVRAYSNYGTSRIYGKYSNIYTATPTLSAPAAFVNSNNYSKVKLSWKGVIGASGYQIYQSTLKSGAYTRVITTSHTSYTKSGLLRGKNYYYKVRAYRYVGIAKVYSNYSYINLKVI